MPNIPDPNAPTTTAVPFADTNRGGLIIRPQLAFGEDPTTRLAGNNAVHYQDWRFTSETYKPTKSTEKSAEISANRGTRDLLLTGLNGMGQVSGEFSANTWDMILEAALCGSWDTVTTPGIGVIQNGVIHRAFAIEKRFMDIQQFFLLGDMEVDTLTLTITAEKIVTIDATFQGGKVWGVSGNTVDAAPTAKTTTPPVTAGINVGQILMNAAGGAFAAYPGKLQSIKLEIKNNLRARPAIGQLYSDVHGQGDFDVTATINGYFGGTQLYAAFLANTAVGLQFQLITPGIGGPGNLVYTFKVPTMKLSDETINIPGRNADVMESAPLTALYDVNGLILEIDKTTVPA